MKASRADVRRSPVGGRRSKDRRCLAAYPARVPRRVGSAPNPKPREQRELNRMQKQLATLVLVFAAAATAAGSAGAAVVRTKDTLPGCGTSTGWT